ncbi:MAG TPA: GTPase ObgE, partial [Patescibacteria group bacterium]|nr:GTPase ObgE [Patescibacteria group bacterium]
AGQDLLVNVPVGTQVMHDGQMIADVVLVGQQHIIARGGDGGFGNAHFKSSTRQAPKVAELGEKGEILDLTLELKLLADVGLVGFPNAGKSTFLSVVSNAKPEIADYPFTTLTPNLGVAEVDDSSLLVADIPGLIEGAAEGKGLGDEFLRHVERTEVLIHMIDIYEPDVAKAYQTINQELAAYSSVLATRPQIVTLTKIEGLPADGIEQQMDKLRQVVPANTPIFAISSQAHIGVTELLRSAKSLIDQVRLAAQKVIDEQRDANETSNELPVIGLAPQQQYDAWHVRRDDHRFIVTGHKIEKFAARTNFDTEPGRRRLWDIISKMGIIHELIRQGLKPGNQIVIGRAGLHKLTYGQ